jgi:hypothetical protein
MDIVEFAEKILGAELNDWQKITLQRLSKVPSGTKVLILPPKRALYYEGIVAIRDAILENKGGDPRAHG